MTARENLNGTSTSFTVKGCDADFLDKMPVHLAFIRAFFQNQGLALDNTREQLKEIEQFLIINRKMPEVHTATFIQGLVAYCGELIRIVTPGNWQVVVSKTNASSIKDRYFPIIVDEAGRWCDFSANVEFQLVYLLNPDLQLEKMCGLYYAVLLARMKEPYLLTETNNLRLPF